MPQNVPTAAIGSRTYSSYGMPFNVGANGRPDYSWLNPNNPTGATMVPVTGTDLGGLGVNQRRGRARQPAPVNLVEATGKRPRPKIRIPGWGTFPGGVLAGFPQRRALSASSPPASNPLIGSLNAINQQQTTKYLLRKPTRRVGPIPKLAPGSILPNGMAWGTGLPPRTVPANRNLGFVAPAYANQQWQDVHQFDYMPDNDESRDESGPSPANLVPSAYWSLPQTIQAGIDGRDIVGTWHAHDFVMGRLMPKQGRSAANWQDMSFGPDWRWLQPVQQVARYNLYTEIALARQPNPNLYFLQYQTSPSIASQMQGQTGQGLPLGYGAA